MNMNKLLFGIVLISFIGIPFVSPAGARMLKEVAIGVFGNAPSQADTDRHYIRYHGPEVVRESGAWISKYQLWLPYEPPIEAIERFGAVRGRYCELWFTEENFADRPQLTGMTHSHWEVDPNEKGTQTNIMVWAKPTEVFYNSDPHPEKTSILRWVTIIRYPEGVSFEDGEKWLLEVHAKEAVKQPGLLKFMSYSAAVGVYDGGFGMVLGREWDRVLEYWYEDFDAWRKAVLDSPPEYTAPPWGGEYPFVEMTSTFTPYLNDVDFLKGTYRPN